MIADPPSHLPAPSSSANKAPSLLATGFALLLLLTGAGLFLTALPPETYDLFWLLYMAAAGWVVLDAGFTRLPRMIAFELPLLFLGMAITLLSIFWSLDAGLTLRAAIAVIGNSLAGIFIGYHFSRPALLRLLAFALTGILLLSLLLGIALPGYGLEPFDRGYLPFALRGASLHRNALGAQAGLALLLYVTLLTGAGPRKGLYLLGCGLALVVLVLAQSMSALATALLGAGVIVVFRISRKLEIPLVVTAFSLLMFAGVIGWFAIAQPELVATALGRDPSFTSRDIIWADAISIIKESPWLGHGYGAVWGQFGSNPFPYLQTMSWAPHAHNGYLQLATEIGLIGALALAIFYLMTLGSAFRGFLRGQDDLPLFALGLIVMALALNLSETWLFVPYEVMWLTFVALAASLARPAGTSLEV